MSHCIGLTEIDAVALPAARPFNPAATFGQMAKKFFRCHYRSVRIVNSQTHTLAVNANNGNDNAVSNYEPFSEIARLDDHLFLAE